VLYRAGEHPHLSQPWKVRYCAISIDVLSREGTAPGRRLLHQACHSPPAKPLPVTSNKKNTVHGIKLAINNYKNYCLGSQPQSLSKIGNHSLQDSSAQPFGTTSTSTCNRAQISTQACCSLQMHNGALLFNQRWPLKKKRKE
jgi:hypothetical protein